MATQATPLNSPQSICIHTWLLPKLQCQQIRKWWRFDCLQVYNQFEMLCMCRNKKTNAKKINFLLIPLKFKLMWLYLDWVYKKKAPATAAVVPRVITGSSSSYFGIRTSLVATHKTKPAGEVDHLPSQLSRRGGTNASSSYLLVAAAAAAAAISSHAPHPSIYNIIIVKTVGGGWP